MCDYCDCRSHPQIAALSADHEEILRLLAGLGRALDADDSDAASGLLAALKERLDPHTRREERGVFVQLRLADIAPDYVDMFEREHHVIGQLVAECSGPDWRRQVPLLIRVLGEHIAREESDMFPAAHQLLRPDQWDAVDASDAAIAAG